MTGIQTEDIHFLATTALTDFWVRNTPMIPLGKFCFARHDPASMSGYSFVDNIDLEMPLDEYKHHVAEYYAIYERILAYLSEWLNEVHGTQYSPRYWRIIVGPFVMWYVEWMYEKYRRITTVYERYPDCHTIGIAPDNYHTPRNTLEFINLSYENDAWNLQLATQIISFLRAGNMTVKTLEWERELQEASAIHGDRKRIAIKKEYRDYTFRILSRLNTNARTVMYLPTMDVADRARLILQSRFKVWPYCRLIQNTLSECSLDTEARNSLRQIKTQDTFEALILSTLAVNLPKIFVEWYQQLSRIKEGRIHHNPRNIVADSGWYFDELFKVWAAGKAENGVRLLGFQHGGNYGGLFFHNHEDHEKKICDFLLSWGWSDSEQVIPAFSQRVRPIKRRADKNDAVLLVVNNRPPYSGIKRSTALEYMEFQFRFAVALDDEILNKLLVRLYPTDYGCGVEQQWREKYPGVSIERAGSAPSFLSRLESCRLIIVDSCNTTMFQSLALNVPTLLFWDPEKVILRESSRPYYDHLKEVGILHETPESAAEYLSTVFNDVDQWWCSEAVQDARRRFCHQYARIDNYSGRSLLEILLKELS